MIPNLPDRKLIQSPPQASRGFRLAEEYSAHISRMIRSGIYSDKILAVVREYSCNAYDAHVDAGIKDRPIEIHWPSLDLMFKVRDYGRGLSPDQMWDVFTVLGASTKRESNDVVGEKGIGCKAGFAYSDSFMVTSWHGGMKSVYTAVINEQDEGVLNLMHQEPCDLSETGLEISVPVKSDDIHKFLAKISFFDFWDVRPKFNIENNFVAPGFRYRNEYGGIFDAYNERIHSGVGHLVTGNVLYQMPPIGGKTPVGLVLFMPIGSVTLSASRESVEQTANSMGALREQYRKFKEVAEAQIERETVGMNPWVLNQYLIKHQFGLARAAGRKCVDAYESPYNPMNSTNIKFVMFDRQNPYNKKRVSRIYPPAIDRAVIMDTTLSQFTLNSSIDRSLLVYPVRLSSDEAVTRMAEWMKNYKIEGLPVIRLSELGLPKKAPTPRAPRSKKNPKVPQLPKAPKVKEVRGKYELFGEFTCPVTTDTPPTAHDLLICVNGRKEILKNHWEILNHLPVYEMVHGYMPKVYLFNNLVLRPASAEGEAGIRVSTVADCDKFLDDLVKQFAKKFPNMQGLWHLKGKLVDLSQLDLPADHPIKKLQAVLEENDQQVGRSLVRYHYRPHTSYKSGYERLVEKYPLLRQKSLQEAQMTMAQLQLYINFVDSMDGKEKA